MKINKEIRTLSREMLRASFTDGRLDPGKISSLVDSVIQRKPRFYLDVLRNYHRLLRLEIEKRQARVESAAPLDGPVAARITNRLKEKYGDDLQAVFTVDPGLLGGVRVRVGNDVWDGSVRNRLERLQQQL
jgi:F-type H+-transporting ATPase subunit delta